MQHLAAAPKATSGGKVGGVVATAVILAVLLGALLGPLPGLFESPAFIERLTVENPTEYHITIDVTGDDRDGWIGVGTAQKRGRSIFNEVIDQGDVWIFRFASQGSEGGELLLTRAELEQSKWTVDIPEEVANSLRAQGAPPSP